MFYRKKSASNVPNTLQLFCLCMAWAKCEPCGGLLQNSGTPPQLVSLIHVGLNVINSRAEDPSEPPESSRVMRAKGKVLSSLILK